MTDELSPVPPAGLVLVALDAFYAAYRQALPSLSKDQLLMIYRRLDHYTREVEDDATRAPCSESRRSEGES